MTLVRRWRPSPVLRTDAATRRTPLIPLIPPGGNSATGCKVGTMDQAFTGAANPYAAGSFTWSIPTQYIDDTATRHTFGSNQNHVSTFLATGYATQAKGGQSGSAALLDDTFAGY